MTDNQWVRKNFDPSGNGAGRSALHIVWHLGCGILWAMAASGGIGHISLTEADRQQNQRAIAASNKDFARVSHHAKNIGSKFD